MSAGAYVPLVMVPRFTSYVGAATYTTAPLDVSEFQKFIVTVWRGLLVGSVAGGAALFIQFEWSDDADQDGWFTFFGLSPLTTAGATDVVEAELTHRYLRLKVTLTDDATDVVALSCWASGHLERRERAA